MLMASVLALTGCRPACPKCADPLPPKIIMVTERCMDLPNFPDPVVLPDPDGQGVTHMPLQTRQDLFILLASVRVYIETQLERCGPKVEVP